MSTAKKVRLKQDEEKLVVAYANLKLKQNRLSKLFITIRFIGSPFIPYSLTHNYIYSCCLLKHAPSKAWRTSAVFC